jgi:hypothetical protein
MRWNAPVTFSMLLEEHPRFDPEFVSTQTSSLTQEEVDDIMPVIMLLSVVQPVVNLLRRSFASIFLNRMKESVMSIKV